MKTRFLHLLHVVDKGEAIRQSVQRIIHGAGDPLLFTVDTRAFRVIPRSPFAYWLPKRVLEVFATLRPLEADGRQAQSGASTMDDFRFLRLWWEVPPTLVARAREATIEGRRWVAIAKGGAYS